MKALGYGLALMTYDGVESLASYARDAGIAYPLISDKRSAIIRALGLLNESYKPGSFAHGVAYPTVLVLDGDGAIRHRLAEESYQDRPGVDAVLRAAGAPPAR